MLEQTKLFPNTFKKFNVFIFNKLGKNQANFSKFNSYPVKFKIPFFIEFLELEGVSIIEALVYYQWLYKGTPSFDNIASFMIAAEFKRIELGVEINYTPY